MQISDRNAIKIMTLVQFRLNDEKVNYTINGQDLLVEKSFI